MTDDQIELLRHPDWYGNKKKGNLQAQWIAVQGLYENGWALFEIVGGRDQLVVTRAGRLAVADHDARELLALGVVAKAFGTILHVIASGAAAGQIRRRRIDR